MYNPSGLFRKTLFLKWNLKNCEMPVVNYYRLLFYVKYYVQWYFVTKIVLTYCKKIVLVIEKKFKIRG